MLKLLGVYKNGNYTVKVLSDGTKIRETLEDEFIPSFAENCDCNCHAGGLKAFFFKLGNFFAKLFNPAKKICACGMKH